MLSSVIFRWLRKSAASGTGEFHTAKYNLCVVNETQICYSLQCQCTSNRGCRRRFIVVDFNVAHYRNGKLTTLWTSGLIITEMFGRSTIQHHMYSITVSWSHFIEKLQSQQSNHVAICTNVNVSRKRYSEFNRILI